MRALTLLALTCSFLLVLSLGAGAVRAEEPPAPPEKPVEKPPESPKPAPEEAAPETDETTPPAETALDPKQGYVKATQATQGLPRAQWMPARRKAAQEFLAKWDASGQEAEAESLLYLARLQQMAERYVDSATSFRTLIAVEAIPETLRAQSASGIASLLANSKSRTPLTEAALCGPCVESVTAYLTAASGEETARLRAGTHRTLANYFSVVDQGEASMAHHMRAAVLNPSLATASARSVLREMMGSTHSMEGYEPLRAGATAVGAVLGALADENLQAAKADLAKLEADGAPDARLKAAKRRVASAERASQMQDRYLKPFALLGKDAPAWTLEHAFGDLKALTELRGKVVVLDFWATWCPWCIKSFPAIRDVLKDYAGKDLVFVGVTASASVVYEARYDLDDDLADRHEPGPRARAVARRARSGQEPDPEKGILPAEEYEAREIAAIETFIQNHEMTWPVVMIDKTEPGPKYALLGWPHAVVIDKQGRIRYFKSGALLRSKPEAVKKFRKVLDDLLAE